MKSTGTMLFSRIMPAIFSTLLVAVSTPAAPRVAGIPGPVRSVAAPDGSGARIFYRPHKDSDGGQESPVFYDDGHGRVQQVATLQRNMSIGWSPDGKRAFLQDNWGSDVADCYVMTRSSTGITGLSLSKLAQRTPAHPTGAEGPLRAHYYVHCSRWGSSDRIIGAIAGLSGGNPVHDFNYPFIYDVRTRRIVWRR